MNFMKDYQFHDALIYVKLGMTFFVVSSAAYIALWSYSIILSTIQGGMLPNLFYHFAIIGLVPSLPPLTLAWATHRKLIKPLRESKYHQKAGEQR